MKLTISMPTNPGMPGKTSLERNWHSDNSDLCFVFFSASFGKFNWFLALTHEKHRVNHNILIDNKFLEISLESWACWSHSRGSNYARTNKSFLIHSHFCLQQFTEVFLTLKSRKQVARQVEKNWNKFEISEFCFDNISKNIISICNFWITNLWQNINNNFSISFNQRKVWKNKNLNQLKLSKITK